MGWVDSEQPAYKNTAPATKQSQSKSSRIPKSNICRNTELIKFVKREVIDHQFSIIPFCNIYPSDPDFSQLKGWVKIKLNLKRKSYRKYGHISLKLTRFHSTPADTPTRTCNSATSEEHQLDSIACACNVFSWQRGAAAFFKQGFPVPIHDCQVVPAFDYCVIVVFICVIIIIVLGFNVECNKL